MAALSQRLPLAVLDRRVEVAAAREAAGAKNDDAELVSLVEDKARYQAYARERYDDLFEELEFRCQRAAMMHYHEANRYSRRCYYLEVSAALLGAVSVSGLGAFLVKVTSSSSSPSGSTTSRLGLLGLLGGALSGLLGFAAKGSSNLVPMLSRRVQDHKQAALGWQRLTRITRSCRIRLRNPCVSVSDYTAWYEDLTRQRETISGMALVPSATYRAFNDPARIFAAIRRKRDMFVTYQGMFEGKMEMAARDYDDD